MPRCRRDIDCRRQRRRWPIDKSRTDIRRDDITRSLFLMTSRDLRQRLLSWGSARLVCWIYRLERGRRNAMPKLLHHRLKQIPARRCHDVSRAISLMPKKSATSEIPHQAIPRELLP